MRRPEEGVVGLEGGEELRDGEAFERGADLGVAGERFLRGEVQQRVQQARIAQVDAGRFDLALLQVLEPRRQHAHHEAAGEDVQIAARGALARAERAGEFGGVPHLAVIVGGHRPEAPERPGGDRDPELRDVAFEEGANEIFPPQRRFADAPREIGTREAAAQPESAPGVRTDLAQVEPGQIDESRAAGERLRNAFDQRGRCAAEQQEPRTIARPVGQHPERFEERRPPLHLVDDDEPLQAAERPLRRLEPPAVHRRFQIEPGAARHRRRDRPGEGGLAALARPRQGDDGVDAERLPDAPDGRGPIDEHGHNP